MPARPVSRPRLDSTLPLGEPLAFSSPCLSHTLSPMTREKWLGSGDQNRDPHLLLPMPKLSGGQIVSPHTSPGNPQAFPD